MEPLPAFEPVSGATAWDDPRTRDALKPRWRWLAAILGAGLVSTLVVTSGTPFAFLGAIGLVSLFIGGLARLILRRRDRRLLRSVLRSGQWTLVNVVVLADMLGRELTGWEQVMAKGATRGGVHAEHKVAAIIDPGTGEVRGTWLPFTRIHSWPGLDVRRWAWVVVSPDVKGAAIAPIDRHVVVGLRRGPGFSKALHDHAWNALRAADLQPAPGGRAMGAFEAGVSHPVDEPERWPNRPMLLRARVMIVAILAAVTVVAGVSDTFAYRSKIAHREALVENGAEATAEVLDYCSCGKSPDEIRLMILDGPYAGFTGTRRVDRGPTKSRGDTIRVFHARDDIEDLYLVGYDQDRRAAGWTLAVATIAVAIGLGITHRRASARP